MSLDCETRMNTKTRHHYLNRCSAKGTSPIQPPCLNQPQNSHSPEDPDLVAPLSAGLLFFYFVPASSPKSVLTGLEQPRRVLPVIVRKAFCRNSADFNV